MKNGVLVCKGGAYKKNIGDYIQSVAQEQFWPNVDCYCEREALNEIKSDETINLIMNGWFMWNPAKFPPAPSINPLFVSFHIVPSFSERFFTKETIAYLKKFEPIGARDYGTRDLLESYGIKSYYSSCLTLTLGMHYKNEKKTDEILFVDPFYKISGTRGDLYNIKLYLLTLFYVLRYSLAVIPLWKNFEYEQGSVWNHISKKLGKFICLVSFYATYRPLFSKRLLQNCKVLTHSIVRSRYPEVEDWMCLAKSYIKRYAAAKMVITSRIHCALPCLAVDTPVIYVDNAMSESMKYRSPGRLGGLKDLLNVLTLSDKGFEMSESLKKQVPSNLIDIDTMFVNSIKYRTYRDDLIKRVTTFVKNCAVNEKC